MSLVRVQRVTKPATSIAQSNASSCVSLLIPDIATSPATKQNGWMGLRVSLLSGCGAGMRAARNCEVVPYGKGTYTSSRNRALQIRAAMHCLTKPYLYSKYVIGLQYFPKSNE